MDEFQYGFIKQSNTLSATVDLTDNISTKLDMGKIVVAVFVDLQKAFDVVDIDTLLGKLYKIGFRDKMYNIIKSYLSNRKQYIKLDSNISETKINECGVPQGSVLGPLFYSLYVLNLQLAGLVAKYYTFADDTVLMYEFENGSEIENIVNLDLRRYTDWLLSNKLKINVGKTKYMLFKQKNKCVTLPNLKINNIQIEHVTKMKYLGLVIDNLLSWSEHINYISGKILPMMSALYKNRSYLSHKSKLNVYNAFVLSRFRYLIPVWGTCGIINYNSMQVLQNKILKVIFNYDPLTHTVDLYENLKVWQLHKVLKFEQSKLIYRIINNTQKSNINILFSRDIHNYNTRSRENVFHNNIRSNKGLNNPVYQASKEYDSLPENIKNIGNYGRFVKHLKEFINAS